MTTTTEIDNTTADAVIREVRRAKEHLARQHGFDIHRIAAAAREKQASSGREVVSRAKKEG